MEGNLGACLSVLSVCPSIRPSFPTVFFSLLSFFSPSSSLSHNCLLLWPPLPILSFPSTLGAAARTPCGLSCAKLIRRITAWLLSQHRVSLGLGPPQTAYPHPGKSAGPSEGLFPSVPTPPVVVTSLAFHAQGTFRKLPMAGGKDSVGSWDSLVFLSLQYALPHLPQGLQPCASCIPELRLL